MASETAPNPKQSAGRPTILTDELIRKASGYVYCNGKQAEWAARGNVIPTIEDFALYLGIHRDTVYAWAKNNDEFSDIVEAIRQDQANILINRGLEGKFNSTIAKLILSGKHGYVEKTEQDITSKGEQITQPVSQDTLEQFIATVKNATKQK